MTKCRLVQRCVVALERIASELFGFKNNIVFEIVKPSYFARSSLYDLLTVQTRIRNAERASDQYHYFQSLFKTVYMYQSK